MRRQASIAAPVLALWTASVLYSTGATAQEADPPPAPAAEASPGDAPGAEAEPAAPSPKARRTRSKDEFVFSELPAGAKAASTVGLIGLTLATVALATLEDPEPGMIALGGVSSGVAVIGFGIAGIIVLADDDEPATAAVPAARGALLTVSRSF
jgi:hypothetical protein